MANHNQDHPEAGHITVGMEIDRAQSVNQFIPSQLLNFSVPYSVL